MRGLVLAGVLLAPFAAGAQPAPRPADSDKGDAKVLMASGLKLFAAKDYLGALAVFQNAYARFPSAKILLNVATTFKALGRDAEAANAYQEYLDAVEVDSARKTEVAKVLAGLDASLGVVAVAVTPTDAEVQINDGEWKRQRHDVRILPGPAHIRARLEHHSPAERTVTVAAGGKVELSLALVPIPQTTTPVAVVAAPMDTGIHASVEPVQRSRFGAIAMAHVDVVHKGGAGFVGAIVELAPRFQIEAQAILGPTYGGYIGARYAFLPTSVRPLIAAGVPIFASGGARFAVRGAAGVELALTLHLAIVAEIGIEHLFNPQSSVAATVFVPALGAVGRL